MTNPTPDHLAVVQAALARKSACRCRLVGPADFEMCDGCDRLSLALRNAAPAIAALADECAAARARIATLEAELVQARARAVPLTDDLHPDGCHTTVASAFCDCSGDGHHECRTCTRFDEDERAKRIGEF